MTISSRTFSGAEFQMYMGDTLIGNFQSAVIDPEREYQQVQVFYEHMLQQTSERSRREAEKVVEIYHKQYGNPLFNAGVPTPLERGYIVNMKQGTTLVDLFPSLTHAQNMRYVATNDTVLKTRWPDADMVKILLDEVRAYLPEDQVIMIMDKDYVKQGFKGNTQMQNFRNDTEIKDGSPLHKMMAKGWSR